MTNKIFYIIIFLVLQWGCESSSKNSKDLPYHNTMLPVESRIKDLISRMTLEEKIGQMQHEAPAIERLDVPAYHWWNECLHGVGKAGLATIFPQAVGMAASWNPSLMFETATAISDEARAKHHRFVAEGKRGSYEGLTFLAPNINIFRDPRWGRGQETYGEDPYLTSRMAVHFIKGLQGNDDQYWKLVATAKHFAVHSGPEASRPHLNVHTSKQDLFETYLPAFEAAVKEAHVHSVMCAYNRYADEACCGSNLLLHTILRDDWKFQGYIVSDCEAMGDLYESEAVHATPAQIAAWAVNNGTDLNCGNTYAYLKQSVEQALIPEEKIDQALYRLFEARFRLGMFDPPDSVPWHTLPYEVVHSQSHQDLALKAARESIVLLKNNNKILPLRKDIRSIAVIGPNADEVSSMLGNDHGSSPQIITPLEGIRRKLGDQVEINHAPGSLFAHGFPRLQTVPAEVLSSEHQRGLKGVYFDTINFTGNPHFTRYDSLINFSWIAETPITHQIADTFAVRWTGYLEARVTGKHQLGVLGSNAVKFYFEDSLSIDFDNEHQPQKQFFSVELKKGEQYPVRLEYINYGPDPQLHLLWSEPGQSLEAEALQAAQNSEVVVLCLGLTPQLEGEETTVDIAGFSGGDRTDIKLPEPQENLLRQIMQLGKPTVLVLMGGSPLAVNWAHQQVPAIVKAWYPGEQGGQAIADVLFGDYNPGGRLPVTFHSSVSDLPDFKNYSMENRTYKFFKGKPLYPFGYGLSYTQFTYEHLQLPDTAQVSDTLQVQVEVKNTGAVAGDEVVQLYVTDLQASVRTPIRSLQGFQRVYLQPGETKTITFPLVPKQMAVVTEGGNFMVEEGMIEISVGGGQPGLAPATSQTLTKPVFLKGNSVIL